MIGTSKSNQTDTEKQTDGKSSAGQSVAGGGSAQLSTNDENQSLGADPATTIREAVSQAQNLVTKITEHDAIYSQEFVDAGIREYLGNIASPNPAESASILKAYDNKTLTILSPTQISSDDIVTTYTGTSTNGAGNVSFDQNKLSADRNYSFVNLLLAQFVVSWPKDASDSEKV